MHRMRRPDHDGHRDGASATMVTADDSLARDHPALLHRLQASSSLLTLLISGSKIYGGTQDGDLHVWSLETYEELARLHAHRGSLLSLSLSGDGELLFSSGGDALVNVWSATTLQRLYSIYSSYDVGDVFSVAFSSSLQVVYLGAQNTSIQWYDLSKKDLQPTPAPGSHPSSRSHRFFDSKGPGGSSTPRPQSAEENRALGGQELQINQEHILQYAHFGYVYCMLLAQNLASPHYQGETLISGGGDGTIKLWSLDAGSDGTINEIHCLSNDDDSILALALYDSLLYGGKLGGQLDVWDLETCQLIRRLRAFNEDVLTVSIGRGLIFAGSSKGNTKIFNHHHLNVSEWQAHEGLILATAVSKVSSREIYVTGGNDGRIAIWDVSDCFDRPDKPQITDNEEMVMDLAKLVSFQTISSKPQYARECRRGASFLRSLFKRFGAETELLNTGEERNPIVFARFSPSRKLEARRKTILFYGHYDVVSANDQNDTWTSKPFCLRKEGGYLYGRGTSDNKGPVLAALYAVADIIKANRLENDIVFLIEGEEESGSKGFQTTIKTNRDLIGDVNWILLANSYWLTDEIPCLTYGLRGVVKARLSVKSARKDLHSGVDGSHLLNEAMKDLVAVLAKLTNLDGRISIPGFYNAIRPITREGEERYETIAKYLLQQNPELGDVESLKASFKARWREPSLTIHRIQHSGSASSSIIPHSVSGDISIRLVSNQTTEAVIKALQAHVSKCFANLRSSNSIRLDVEHRAEPWLGDPSNEVFRVLEAAVTDIWQPTFQQQATTGDRLRDMTNQVSRRNGQKDRDSVSLRASPLTSTDLSMATNSASSLKKENLSKSLNGIPARARRLRPLYIREGGSIPAIRFLEQEFSAPAAHLPCGQASDSAHLDNERFRVTNLYNSRRIFERVFINLGKV